jgi:hypothetical protein
MTDPTTAPSVASTTPLAGTTADRINGSTVDPAACRPVEGHLVCARRHLLAAHRQRHRLAAHRHLRYARRHLLAAHPGVLYGRGVAKAPAQHAPDLRAPAARTTRRHLTPYHLTPYRISCPARHSLPGARHLRLPCHRSLSACRHLQRSRRQLRQLQRGATRGLE